MMKKLFAMMAVAMIALTGCGEAPTATLEPEGTETIIVENTITENVTGKLTYEEAKELYYHPYWEDQNNDALFHEWRAKYDGFDENDYTDKDIWELRFMTAELANRLEEDGYVYEYDINDEDLEHVKALCNPSILISKEYLDTLRWNLHDIYEYGTTFR